MQGPLAQLLIAAAAGRFPPADGGWHRVPPWRSGLEAIFGFTGHAVLAVRSEVTDETLTSLGADGFGGAHDPRLITNLAGPDSWIDSLDVVMIGTGTARSGTSSDLVERPDLASHPRARAAATHRADLRVFGYQDDQLSTVVTLGRGLADLPELSFELHESRRGRGHARQLVEDARALHPRHEPLLASVAPGNAASLRTLLATGFIPVGSVQLFRTASHPPA